MTDWDLMTPGIGLTTIGIAGVGMSLSGIAKTFIDGMHAVSLLTMFIGMIFLASGLFKDGFPSTGRAKSAAEAHSMDRGKCACKLSDAEHAELKRKMLTFFRLQVSTMKHFIQ